MSETNEVKLRETVVEGAQKAAQNLTGIANGAPYDAGKMRANEALLRAGMKATHLNQIQDQSRTSNAIRVANLLRDPAMRDRYIAETQPRIAGFLRAAPSAKRKKRKED